MGTVSESPQIIIMNRLFHMVKPWAKIKRMAIFRGMYTLLDEIISKHRVVILALNRVALDTRSSQYVFTC